MARFAKRVRSIGPSATLRLVDMISDRNAQGAGVLSLALGEPDFPTPAHVVEAAKMALDKGYTKYTPAAGLRELREAIADKSRKENGIPAKPEHVLVAPTKHTLFMTCMALLDAGDEAIVPDPGWVSYAPIIRLAGATPVPVPAADDDGFVLTADRLAEAITERTRLVIVNSPSNPAGAVFPREAMRGLADLVRDHDLVLVSDEIYEKILYDGEHVSPASLDGMYDRTVTVHGFSKTYSMTGWRLGWLVATPAIHREIAKVQEHTITCATAFAQMAGVAALRGPAEPVRKMVEEFRVRRDLVLRELGKIDGVSTFRPGGAFYVFPKIDTPMESAALCERIFKEGSVAVTPGTAFGAAGEGHIRISYAASRETIVEGMQRLGRVLSDL